MNSINIPLPYYVKRTMDMLSMGGYKSYLVGGCVRDALMGVCPHDYDLCSNALPDEMVTCFAGYPILENGRKHGTIAVIIDKNVVEVTTFRVDGEYSDNRHPESVVFTDKLSADLSRRDFTINSMAWSPDDGLTDLFEGRKHLEDKKIVCVGNPDKRFKEDGLRILRALRFASVLEFSIQDNVKASIINNKGLLENISRERVMTEFRKLACGKGAQYILDEFFPVYEQVIPELKFSKDKWHWSANAISECTEDFAVRFAILMLATENPTPEAAETALRGLKADNRLIRSVKNIMAMCEPLPRSLPELRRLAGKYGYDDLKRIILFHEAAETWETRDVCKTLHKDVIAMQERRECIDLHGLAINGETLACLGVAKGKRTGRLLQHLLEEVIDEHVENTEAALIAYLKEEL